MRDAFPAAYAWAIASPTLLLAALRAWEEASGRAVPIPWPMLLFLGALVTLPVVALAVGSWRIARHGGARDEDVKSALEAVVRAEKLAREAAEALARAGAPTPHDAALGPPRPRPRAGALAAWACVLLLAVSGVALALVRAPPDPVHIHVGVAVFDEGARLRFDDPRFDLSVRKDVTAHLHLPDEGTFHLEGPPGIALSRALAIAVGLEWPDGARAWTLHEGSARWLETGPNDAPRDQDRILVVLGGFDPEALPAMQAAVPTPLVP